MVEKNEEKEEFLKREEIRTMYKDMVRLQEKEALAERERIASIRTEEEIRKERERMEKLKKEELEMRKAREEAEMRKEIIRKAKEEEIERRKEAEKERKEKILEERRLEREKAWQLEEEERRKLLERLRARGVAKEKEVPEKEREILVPRPVLKRPSFLEKIFIRILILLLLFGFLGLLVAFWYWYFREREVPSLPTPPPEEIIPRPEETIPPVEETKELIIPPSLITIEQTETLEISKIEEIPEKINQALAKEIAPGSFKRILIKNLPKNELVSLSQFFEAFQIKTPDNFYQKLGENYTLFIYSQEAGKRLGFLSEIKEKEGFPDLLKSWEKTMEKDFENLFRLLGKKEPALLPSFKDGQHQGVSFRFQTFTRQDLGICYSLFDNYFLFTSSGEAITKTIDKLMSKPP